jgi:hypothetical protein
MWRLPTELGHAPRDPTNHMMGCRSRVCPTCLLEIAGAVEKIDAAVARYKEPTPFDKRGASIQSPKRLAHHKETE